MRPCIDGDHKRWFNLDTKSFVCEYCLADWESLKSKKTLYCAAFMVRTPHGWAGEMLYMHVDCVEDARLQFFQSEQRHVREVNIAPVVGYLANDDHGDSVSV